MHKPLKLNQHGLYVLDTKRWHTMQTDQRIDQVTALIASGVPGASSASSGTPAPDTTCRIHLCDDDPYEELLHNVDEVETLLQDPVVLAAILSAVLRTTDRRTTPPGRA